LADFELDEIVFVSRLIFVAVIVSTMKIRLF